MPPNMSSCHNCRATDIHPLPISHTPCYPPPMNAIQSFLKSLPGPDAPPQKSPLLSRERSRVRGTKSTHLPTPTYPSFPRFFATNPTPNTINLRHHLFPRSNSFTPHYPHHHGHRPPSSAWTVHDMGLAVADPHYWPELVNSPASRTTHPPLAAG